MIDLATLRPKSVTVADIRAALALIQEERAAVRKRLSDEAERWPALLLVGSTAAIRAAEQAKKDDEINEIRLDALEAELSKRLTEAAATEAGAARAQQVLDAAAKIEAFNTWLATVYTEHARAIAAGVELERFAWRAIEALRDPRTKAIMAELPPLARAYVNNDARGLGFLTRLPAATPGTPIVWP